MIESGQVRMEVWELLCDCLPSDELKREANSDRASSMGFCSGAYSRGPLFGLRRNTTLFAWVTLLVCKFIRSCTHVPFTSFVLQRNTSMGVHRGLNNARDSVNVLLPCSAFRGGGLWIEKAGGRCASQDGTLFGEVHNLTMSGITFNPHQRHETYPWRGTASQSRYTPSEKSIRFSRITVRLCSDYNLCCLSKTAQKSQHVQMYRKKSTSEQTGRYSVPSEPLVHTTALNVQAESCD